MQSRTPFLSLCGALLLVVLVEGSTRKRALLVGLVVLALPALGLLQGVFPVMVVLGPLIVLQYVLWRRHSGQERTTWQAVQADRAWENG